MEASPACHVPSHSLHPSRPTTHDPSSNLDPWPTRTSRNLFSSRLPSGEWSSGKRRRRRPWRGEDYTGAERVRQPLRGVLRGEVEDNGASNGENETDRNRGRVKWRKANRVSQEDSPPSFIPLFFAPQFSSRPLCSSRRITFQ